MDIHPATSQHEAGQAPLSGARENCVLFTAVELMLLALLNLLCRRLHLSITAPAAGWTVPQLVEALAALFPLLRQRRRRLLGLRPFIPRCQRRGSPHLLIVHAYRLPPRDPARPLRRLPPRPRQGRGPPPRAPTPSENQRQPRSWAQTRADDSRP